MRGLLKMNSNLLDRLLSTHTLTPSDKSDIRTQLALNSEYLSQNISDINNDDKAMLFGLIMSRINSLPSALSEEAKDLTSLAEKMNINKELINELKKI